MTTRFIGIKELRQNMAQISLTALKNHQRVIVLRKNKPVFELRPLAGHEQALENLVLEIQKAQGQAKKGQLYTPQQVRKNLGL
ncbi:hypothetical protein HY224_01120 [Candidatus Uhrbacteria bacterium]|nr:hypothetical protein [Candidatus Uhrbacteria bacterium]